jgi:hypothetical protein
MSAVVDHIKNVFKHKKQHERTKNVTNAAEKNTEKRKKENRKLSGLRIVKARRCCLRHSGESRRCTIEALYRAGRILSSTVDAIEEILRDQWKAFL